MQELFSWYCLKTINDANVSPFICSFNKTLNTCNVLAVLLGLGATEQMLYLQEMQLIKELESYFKTFM